MKNSVEDNAAVSRVGLKSLQTSRTSCWNKKLDMKWRRGKTNWNLWGQTRSSLGILEPASVSHYVQPLCLGGLRKQPVLLPWAAFLAGQGLGETGGGDPAGRAACLAAASWWQREPAHRWLGGNRCVLSYLLLSTHLQAVTPASLLSSESHAKFLLWLFLTRSHIGEEFWETHFQLS